MRLKYTIYILILYFNWGNCQSIFNRDSLTILADSLHNQGNYKEAMVYRKKALVGGFKDHDYQKYIKAKFYHTNSARLEFQSYNYHNPDAAITKRAREQYLDSALQYAVKARDCYTGVKSPDKKFLYNIQNRIYHQTAYLGNWKHALEQAQLGLNILKDTLSPRDKTFVDLIYDIGYIYSKLGDYSKSVENYQTSLNLYENIIGKNHADIALTYNNISVEYRNLGLRKNELESLLKAETIWENLNDNDNKKNLYSCYRNLFYWYSYYGDFDKAEEYILKKQKLRTDEFASKINGFLRNKEEIYEDKLREWYDLMLHYYRKEDATRTDFYAQNIIKTINPNKKLLSFEISIFSSTLKFYATFLEQNNKDKALYLLDKAISVQQNYKSTYYTKELPFLLVKADLLIKYKKIKEAVQLLEQIDKLDEKREVIESFKLNILKGRTNQELKKYTLAQYNFDHAFQLLKSDSSSLEQTTTFNKLKPLISFEVIEGFLSMGDFYMQLWKEKNEDYYLHEAMKRYLLVSEIYNQLYLGERYNNRLYKSYNAINERLLSCSVSISKNQNELVKVLNAIENNGSKLIWSKFVFNNQRQQLDMSEHFLNKEDAIKGQLNFYQKKLLAVDTNDTDKISLWKEKVFEYKNELLKIQDSIKQNNKAYYQFNIKHFDVTDFQSSLGTDEVILKYVQTDDKLYLFQITKKELKLQFIADRAVIFGLLKTCLDRLKNRDNNYQNLFNTLKNLLLQGIPYSSFNKVTIVPDGALQYFPFEVLIMADEMPSVSYSSSLLLYDQQRSISNNSKNVVLGAFSASNPDAKLANVSEEVKGIVKILGGKTFFNASKNQFLESANQFNILHLAMHSHIDNINPEFSALDFYGKSNNQLYVSELYNEAFKANMAVLSACDTGNGFYENGEGVISLSRAFNYAGIPSTVMSLWEVDDEATSKIMSYFYTHLKNGEDKDEALKNAKFDYLENTNDNLLKHPYYWSGFVLTGNTEALFKPNDYRWVLILLPILFLLLYRKRLFQFFKK